MKLTRGIAILPVAVALGLTASAQTADIDPNAKPQQARPSTPPVVAPANPAADISPVPGSGQLPAQNATLVEGTTANQSAEVLLGGPSGPAKIQGYYYLNGGFVTGSGNGAGGANTSQIVNGSLFGYGHQLPIPIRVADNFPVAAGETVSLGTLVWRAYQTGAPTTGTITDINVNLWDTDPSLGGAASQTGPANSFVSQVWSGAYRVSSTSLTSSGRAIIDVTGDMSWTTPLDAGTYWVDVACAGSLSSGPWAPPVVPEGNGDGLQDTGSGFVTTSGNDDFPFELFGTALASGVCYNNGGFVTGTGNGAGGANTSQIVNGSLFGYGHQLPIPIRVADDFPVSTGTELAPDALIWRAYQTGAPTTGTITDININLWDTDPSLGGSPSQTGPANSFVSQVWSGAYRVSSTSLTSSGRAIIDVTGDLSWATAPLAGTHWIDVACAGSLSSGPWAPPVVPEGNGNGLQDTGSGFVTTSGNDDFPFEIKGVGSCGPIVYCVGKVNSCGVIPDVGVPAGFTSQGASAAGSFDITLGLVKAKSFGVMFYTTDGEMLPINNQFGTFCININSGIFRVPAVKSSGTGCTGVFTVDFGDYLATQNANPLLTSGGLASSGGETIDAHIWYRDPPNPGGANLSNAFRFLVLP